MCHFQIAAHAPGNNQRIEWPTPKFRSWMIIAVVPEHDAEEWQAAMQALLLVAEHDGPTMFARIGVRQAINRHVERVFDPSRKHKHWGRSKLARDR
jgi:hypothetical protein